MDTNENTEKKQSNINKSLEDPNKMMKARRT